MLVQRRVEVQNLASVTVPAVNDEVDGETHQRVFGPMAPPEGHTCHIEGVDLLAGNMFSLDHVRSAVARAHFTGAIVNDDSEGDDFVPYGSGAKRGWLPSDHVQWALDPTTPI